MASNDQSKSSTVVSEVPTSLPQREEHATPLTQKTFPNKLKAAADQAKLKDSRRPPAAATGSEPFDVGIEDSDSPTKVPEISNKAANERSSQKRKANQSESREETRRRKRSKTKSQSCALPTEKDIGHCLSSDDNNAEPQEAQTPHNQSSSHHQSAVNRQATIILIDSDDENSVATGKDVPNAPLDDDLPDAPINVAKDFYDGKHIDERILSKSQRAYLTILREKSKETPQEARRRMAKRFQKSVLTAAPIIVKRTEANPLGLLDGGEEKPRPKKRKKRSKATTEGVNPESSAQGAEHEDVYPEAAEPKPKAADSNEVWWVPDGKGGYEKWSGGAWRMPDALNTRLQLEATQKVSSTWTKADEAATIDQEATNIPAPVRKRDRRGFDWWGESGYNNPAIREKDIELQKYLCEEAKKCELWLKRKEWIDTTANAAKKLEKREQRKKKARKQMRQEMKERLDKEKEKLKALGLPIPKDFGKRKRRGMSLAASKKGSSTGKPESGAQSSHDALPAKDAAAPEGEFDLNDFDLSGPGMGGNWSEYSSDLDDEDEDDEEM